MPSRVTTTVVALMIIQEKMTPVSTTLDSFVPSIYQSYLQSPLCLSTTSDIGPDEESAGKATNRSVAKQGPRVSSTSVVLFGTRKITYPRHATSFVE
jgi:hypothetical protein